MFCPMRGTTGAGFAKGVDSRRRQVYLPSTFKDQRRGPRTLLEKEGAVWALETNGKPGATQNVIDIFASAPELLLGLLIQLLGLLLIGGRGEGVRLRAAPG